MPIVTIGENTSDDFTGLDDTYMAEDDPTTNKSSAADLSIGKYNVGAHGHALFRFPGLSNITGPVTVTEVRLYGNVEFLNVGADGHVFTLRRCLRTVDFSTVNWNIYSTGNSWQTGGGLGSSDRDNSASLGTWVILNTAAPDDYIYATGSGFRQAVEDAINTASSLTIHVERTDGANDEEFFAFKSSQAGADGSLPYLYIDYEIGGSGVTTRVADDSVVLIDNNVYGIRRYRSSEDNVVVTEGPTQLSTIWSGFGEDNLTILDFSSYFLRRNRAAEDTIVMVDLVGKMLRFTVVATENLIVIEGPTEFMTVWEALITESIDLVDEYLRRMLLTRLSNDSIVTIDSFISSATGQQIISSIAEDVIAVTSQAFANLYRNRGLDDVASVIDSRDQLTLRSVMASRLTDMFDLIDSVAALFFGTVVVNPSAIRIGVNQPNIVLGGYVI